MEAHLRTLEEGNFHRISGTGKSKSIYIMLH